ncbi:HutD family protein [Fusobacterium sp. PH5-44]|uniref:HutD family protein n=1 Tax=unclassified Fusobacterium TaxID=2648384 RepID=UPI003D1A518E
MDKIIKKENWYESKWSGGVTKELYIHPENSRYSEKNFNFRISIAITENEESTFTKLNGVDRVISIIKGKLKLFHEGHYNKILLPYEIDRFNGGWNTTSKGKVTDFNLMLKNCKGDFFFKEFKYLEELIYENLESFTFVYCIEGSITVNNKILKQDELIIVEKKQIKLSSEIGKIFYGYITI